MTDPKPYVRGTLQTYGETKMAQIPVREMSQAELDEEMYERIENGTDNTKRYEALQRAQDRREKGRW
jgi:hypothetical protein